MLFFVSCEESDFHVIVCAENGQEARRKAYRLATAAANDGAFSEEVTAMAVAFKSLPPYRGNPANRLSVEEIKHIDDGVYAL